MAPGGRPAALGSLFCSRYECSTRPDERPGQTANRHLWRRLLLVRGGGFPAHPRRQIGHLRLCRRHDRQPHLPRGLHRRNTGTPKSSRFNSIPPVITYEKLLEIFWEAHDPTTLNRQGEDVGTQYRSIILYSDAAQKAAAEKSKAEAARHFSAPIVTQIVPLQKFYPAEGYHQNYYNLHSNQNYCRFVIGPKLRKLIEHGVIPQDK